MKIRFTKMSGAGNDFVIIDNRRGIASNGSALARKLCNRHWGIGADGLLLLEKSRAYAYKMRYFNADGSYGGMCGNGGRCIAAFAVKHNIARASHEFEALNHVYGATVGRQSVKLSMKDPKRFKMDLVLPVRGKRIPAMFVDTGSPHVIFEAKRLSRKGLEGVEVSLIGRTIRHSRRFYPSGTNVNVIEIKGTKSLKIRTYERGVEAETLACGTGAVAAAVTAYRNGLVKTPVSVWPLSGERLIVDFGVTDGKISNVTLEGGAKFVFAADIEL